MAQESCYGAVVLPTVKSMGACGCGDSIAGVCPKSGGFLGFNRLPATGAQSHIMHGQWKKTSKFTQHLICSGLLLEFSWRYTLCWVITSGDLLRCFICLKVRTAERRHPFCAFHAEVISDVLFRPPCIHTPHNTLLWHHGSRIQVESHLHVKSPSCRGTSWATLGFRRF